MAVLKSLPGIEDQLRRLLFSERMTHEQIGADLRRRYPGLRGLSARSVRRFCSSEGLGKTSRLTSHELDKVVTGYVRKVIFWQSICFTSL